VESEQKGLSINRQKLTCVVIWKSSVTLSCNITVNGDKLKQVDHFIYLGSLISQDGRRDKEIKRRIGISKNFFHNTEKVLTFTSNKYVYKTVFTEELWMWKLTISHRIKSQLEATKMWFYGVCCILHGLTKCQMKKYFTEPIHQEISWRWLLTDKSDL